MKEMNLKKLTINYNFRILVLSLFLFSFKYDYAMINNICPTKNEIILDTLINNYKIKIDYNKELNTFNFQINEFNKSLFSLKSFDSEKHKSLTEGIFIRSKGLNTLTNHKVLYKNGSFFFFLKDKFDFFGIYIVKINKNELEINCLNLIENISYTDMVYVDLDNELLIFADRTTFFGNENLVKIYSIKNEALCNFSFILDWNRYKKKLKKHKNDYPYYNLLIDLVIKKKNKIKKKCN